MQLINGICNDIKKLLKYFNVTTIFALFTTLPAASTPPVIAASASVFVILLPATALVPIKLNLYSKYFDPNALPALPPPAAAAAANAIF